MMKKPYAAGALLVACSTAALMGLGSTANASVSASPAPHSHVSVASAGARQGVSPNRCDGDHDSDDIGCGKASGGEKPASAARTACWVFRGPSGDQASRESSSKIDPATNG